MFRRTLTLTIALALLIGLGMAASSHAGDYTGSMWYRWQGMDNYTDQNSSIDDGWADSMMRSRISFAGETDSDASYNLTLQNFHIFGDPSTSINSVYQASFTMRHFLFHDVDVTVGRMPVSYGRERVFGVDDWDLGRDILFDGVHARYSFDSGWVDVFGYKLKETYQRKYEDRPARAAGDSNLVGMYMHYDFNDDCWIEPYAMLTMQENWADPDVNDDRMFTFGGLVDYMHEGLHFYGEATVQKGKRHIPDTQDISAVGWYAGLFYDFDSSTEPYLGFEYDYASGQDDSGDMKVFSSPYGSTSDYLGIMNIVDWSNVNAMRFAGGFTPVDNLDVSADFFLFSLAEDVGGEDAIGNELDVKLNYLLNADVDLEAGLGMFTYDEASAGYMDPGDPLYFVWAGSRLFF